MSLTKIPDSLINKFKCAECNCYLSMAPVGVRSDGESVCKRCTDWIAPQSVAVARCKAFEELARLHLFPCNYRSQGCMEYVQFNRAFEHENKCAYHTYTCPANVHSACNWVGTIHQICSHYKDQHPELYLKTPNFRIDIDDNYEIYYLVEVDGIMFLLQIKVEDGKCWFNSVYVGYDANKLSYIKYRVKLIGEDSTRAMELEDKKPLPITRMEMLTTESIEVDIEGLLVLLKYPLFIQCHWLITIPQEFQEHNASWKQIGNDIETEKIKCSNCKFCMVPPIYRCLLGHVICADCKGYNGNCEVCQQTNVAFSRAIDLENAAQTTKFLCKWRNCKQTFCCDDIRAHEQQCVKRIYRCPKCNQYVGIFNKVFKHFKNVHEHISFEVVKSDTLSFAVKSVVVYVLVHNEIFQVTINKDVSNFWTVYITYYGPPSLESLWKYEVRDHYNTLYYASKCSNNRYRATQHNIDSTSSTVRSEYYLTVRFNKQKKSDIWIPFDCLSKRIS